AASPFLHRRVLFSLLYWPCRITVLGSSGLLAVVADLVFIQLVRLTPPAARLADHRDAVQLAEQVDVDVRDIDPLAKLCLQPLLQALACPLQVVGNGADLFHVLRRAWDLAHADGSRIESSASMTIPMNSIVPPGRIHVGCMT